MELGVFCWKNSECVLQLDACFVCGLDLLCSFCQHVSDLELAVLELYW